MGKTKIHKEKAIFNRLLSLFGRRAWNMVKSYSPYRKQMDRHNSERIEFKLYKNKILKQDMDRDFKEQVKDNHVL